MCSFEEAHKRNTPSNYSFEAFVLHGVVFCCCISIFLIILRGSGGDWGMLVVLSYFFPIQSKMNYTVCLPLHHCICWVHASKTSNLCLLSKLALLRVLPTSAEIYEHKRCIFVFAIFSTRKAKELNISRAKNLLWHLVENTSRANWFSCLLESIHKPNSHREKNCFGQYTK